MFSSHDSPSLSSDLKLSVIIPVCDPRFKPDYINTWVRQIHVEPGTYEIVILCHHSRLPELQNLLGPMLRSHDRIIPSDDGREAALYALGGKSAYADRLFFTEDHCCAARDCVAEIFDAITKTPDLQAAYTTSRHINRTLAAKCEAREFDDLFENLWSLPDIWNHVRLRGFYIRKEIYLRAGGFHPEFDLFSEEILSAQLRKINCAIIYIPAAIIFHANSSITEIYEHTARFVYSRNRFIDVFLTSDHAFVSRFWSTYIEPLFKRRELPPESRCHLNNLLIQQLRFLIRTAPHESAYSSTGILPALLGWIRLQIPPLWINRIRYHLSCRILNQLKRKFLSLPPHQLKTAYPIYSRMRPAIIENEELRYCLDHPVPPRIEIHQKDRYEAPDLSVENLCAGFYPLEHYEGKVFRWSSGASLLKLKAHTGKLTLIWDTGGVMGEAPLPKCAFYLNSHPVPLKYRDGMITLETEIREPVFHLGLICQTISVEERNLGIPITSLRIYSSD